jgi:hypothetical protein
MDTADPTEDKIRDLVRRVSGQAMGISPKNGRLKIAALETSAINMAALLSEHFRELATFAGLTPVAAAAQMLKDAPPGDLDARKKVIANVHVLMNMKLGGAPEIEMFENMLYAFALSFGELCSQVRPEFDPKERKRAEMAAVREKKEGKNDPAETELLGAVRHVLCTHKPAKRSIEYARLIQPLILERLTPLNLTRKDGGPKPDGWPGEWTIRGFVTKELDRLEGKTASLPDK